MQDKYSRNINYLRLSITDLCNYRCIYCMDSDGIKKRDHSEILRIEELINIAGIAVECGINKIRITGGEPLVRKGVLKLCEGIRSINGVDELAITTNGAKLSEMAEDLKLSGVDRLNISLDTLNEDKFRKITVSGSLSEVLSGINAAYEAGFKNTKINVVLMAGINDDEIVDFVNITKDNPLCVRFIELMPIGPSKKWYDKRFISTNEVLKKVPQLHHIERNGVADMYKLDGAAGCVGLISPVSHMFCSDCNRLRVTADGRLLPCLHSDLEYSIRGMTDEKIKAAFIEAVNNKPVRHHIVEKHVSDNLSYMQTIGG